uniref:VTT domain-containing protein n=1 Tax=Caenorhabditis japonica TaxID=281687 RepID=A0A8R1DL81_CAEJA
MLRLFALLAVFLLSTFSLFAVWNFGPLPENLLAGALFGTLRGVFLVCTLNSLGASFCFILSALFAAPIVDRLLKAKIENLRLMVNAERDRLWVFLLSARVFPFTPHWLLNVSSPFLGVPLWCHTTSVLVGLFPYNLLCVRAGTVLAEVHSMSDVFDFWTLSELFSVSMILLIAARVARRNSMSGLAKGVKVS